MVRARLRKAAMEFFGSACRALARGKR